MKYTRIYESTKRRPPSVKPIGHALEPCLIDDWVAQSPLVHLGSKPKTRDRIFPKALSNYVTPEVEPLKQIHIPYHSLFTELYTLELRTMFPYRLVI